MGQLNENFVAHALEITAQGNHPPLTVWETRQLLLAWQASRAAIAKEGWKLVPVEPTETMLRAGAWGYKATAPVLKSIYGAMLAAVPDASPAPPEQEVESNPVAWLCEVYRCADGADGGTWEWQRVLRFEPPPDDPSIRNVQSLTVLRSFADEELEPDDQHTLSSAMREAGIASLASPPAKSMEEIIELVAALRRAQQLAGQYAQADDWNDWAEAAQCVADELLTAIASRGGDGKDGERLDLLTSADSRWSIHREKVGSKPWRWRMRDDGEPWGRWHDNPRAALDQAIAADRGSK